jgi:hypothetical protein
MLRTISCGLVFGALVVGLLAVGLLARAWSADAATKAATTKMTGFTAEAIVLPPRTVGKTVVRASAKLAVEIRVRVQNYRAGGFEPLLVIDGKSQTLDSGVRGVEGKQTILGFVVESPNVLRDGATVALQMAADAKSPTPVPGRLSLKAIKPLPTKESEQARVPALDEWLRSAPPPRK